MKAQRAQIERALKAPGDTRLFLLHGPDEAGSRALAKRLADALGADAERVDLAPATLKSDPARLPDEAAAVALFGGPRHIRVEGAGEESLAAAQALLEAPAAGNPAVLIAGTLKATSGLLKLATAHPLALAFASYVPGGAELERIAAEEGRTRGLRIDAALARRLAAAAGGDRAILAAELDKYADYLDAAPDAPQELTHAAVDALSADAGDADVARLVHAVAGGDPAGAEAELMRLAASGTSAVLLVRAVQRRLLLLAELRGKVDGGNSIASVLANPASGVWRQEQEAVGRELRLWTAPALATALERVAAAGRAAMSARGPGELGIDRALGQVARGAARGR